MYHRAIHIFVLIVIFYFQYNFMNVKAIIGYNIKYAKDKQFPSVVCLKEVMSRGNEQIRCTGTLISLSHVLTAEHCLTAEINITVTPIIVVVGSAKVKRGTRYNILWWLSYQRWSIQVNQTNNFRDNDIAILKLRGTASDKIIPSVVSTFTESQLYGLDVITAGFGQINNGETSGRLTYVSLQIITRNQCHAMVSRVENQSLIVDENLLCTFVQPYAQLDSGDSGGPLFYGDILVGVNTGRCPETTNEYVFHPGKVNVHANVALYLFYINQTLAIQN